MINFLKNTFKDGLISGLINLSVYIIIGSIGLYLFIKQWELLFSIPPLKWVIDIIKWIISFFN